MGGRLVIGTILGISLCVLGTARGATRVLANGPGKAPTAGFGNGDSRSAQVIESAPMINGVEFKFQKQNGVVLVCKLTLSGANYESGSMVLIEGQPAPKVLYVSSNQVVAKGGAKLNKMLPKGRAVALTVRNPDGQTSTAWSFER